MNVKKKARRVMSGLLTAVTVLSTVLSPAVAYASDDAGSVKKIPYYEEIKDQLDEDEVVTAKDYEIKVGDNFDVKSDYTGLTIQDDSKVKVTFQEAKDTDGNDFSTDYANSYKAVYYVEPQTTDHPTYQINRKIVVKEADQQKDSQSESSSDQDAGSSDKTETEDSEADSSTEETDAADTESKTELTEKEFDAEIEATEDQETVDPETGITLSEVMQEAVDQEVALADLEAGESITFDMPMMLASGETGTKSVTVTAGSWYYYADYGLGSYLTCPYYVKWGSINATAYCVEPSKKGPGNGTYTIQKLADGKTLAKVCYYGTKASDSVEIWKRFRKWGGIPSGITQNIKDLLASREIENIFENSDFILMLNQAAGDRQILAKQLNISPYQLSYVTNSGEGEGLLFYGTTIIPFKDKFDKNLKLYSLMTTKPEEVEKREKEMEAEKHEGN